MSDDKRELRVKAYKVSEESLKRLGQGRQFPMYERGGNLDMEGDPSIVILECDGEGNCGGLEPNMPALLHRIARGFSELRAVTGGESPNATRHLNHIASRIERILKETQGED